MPSGEPSARAFYPWKVAIALCCALLLIFGMTVQVAHVHSAADSSHASCALCATAHVVVSPAAPIAAPMVVQSTAVLVIDLEPSFARRYPYFSLYTRPPPVEIALP